MADETAAFENITQTNAAIAPSVPGAARRAQHAKHHGCVSATFTVRDDVPEALRLGVFKPGASFSAKIRFSNGAKQDDREKDAHGMAIKLLDVPGRKLLEGRETETAQDFVLTDNETFPTGDIDTYIELNRRFLLPDQTLSGKLALGLWIAPRLPLFFRVLRFRNHRATSPLTQHYWSTMPYSIGGTPVKWLVRPISTRTAKPVLTPDGLAEALWRDLAEAPFTFDFGADLQNDPERQPIEDPSVAWSAKGAQRVWLARIEIAAQKVEPHAELAEDIAYSPWHCLVEHTPLGAMNRSRKYTYRKLAIHRHELNGVKPADTSELPVGRQ